MHIMASRKAILVTHPGGPERLTRGEVPRPICGEDELLVRVHATALNRADLLQRQGRYPPPPGASELLGLEVAGVVEEVGAACSTWSVGDRVFGLLPGGGYAEFALLHCALAMAVPPDLTLEEAAAIPEVFLTAYQALHWYGKIEESHVVLIHAGASGVGTAAIQLARASGARVFATASERKLSACTELGAERAVDYRTENFADVVLGATDGRGADIVVDFIGAPYFHDNLRTLAMDGRLIILATMGGSSVSEFNLRALFRKRAHLITSSLRSRDVKYKAELTADFARLALPLLAAGKLRPVIDAVLDWSDVRVAHERMEENRNVGKLVLRIRNET